MKESSFYTKLYQNDEDKKLVQCNLCGKQCKIAEDDSDVFLIAYDFLSKICIGKPQLSQKTQDIIDNLVGVQIAKKYTLKVTEGNNSGV